MTTQKQKITHFITENAIQFVSLHFTGMVGDWHSEVFHVDVVNDKFFDQGVLVDGSSIPGWKNINNSDVGLMPDLETFCLDPFAAHPTMILVADAIDPVTGKTFLRDPRVIAKKAQNYLENCGFADKAFFGPEPEFFIFDEASFSTDSHDTYVSIAANEASKTGRAKRESSHNVTANITGFKKGYMSSGPFDTLSDLRSEILLMMKSMGFEIEKHHHEVASSQHEIGFRFGQLVETADNLQKMKYAVRMTAASYGKSATFMPKPIIDDNGSGMHVHQSLWKGDAPLFDGKEHGNLSELALYYVGGILKHAKALNAFCNPTFNSYRRLVPGFEAPVNLCYALANRSAACRIPVTKTAKERRVEVRFPDGAANPYLALAAMLMAGLDGIKNKIHPGKPSDQDLFDAKAKRKNLPHLSVGLEDALNQLQKDHSFLLQGDVFSKDFIDAYIEQKRKEVDQFNKMPTPLEFELYYNR